MTPKVMIRHSAPLAAAEVVEWVVQLKMRTSVIMAATDTIMVVTLAVVPAVEQVDKVSPAEIRKSIQQLAEAGTAFRRRFSCRAGLNRSISEAVEPVALEDPLTDRRVQVVWVAAVALGRELLEPMSLAWTVSAVAEPEVVRRVLTIILVALAVTESS